MKRLLVGLVLLGLAAGVAMAHCGACDGDAKTVTGVVTVTKDDKGEVTAVKVGDVAIAMDDNAKKVVEMAGKNVTVTGKIKAKAVVVETVKEAEAAPAPAQ